MLVGVDLGEYDCEASLDELEELAKTAGAEVEARVTQRRETPDSATFIGSGRLREIKNFCADNDVDLLIFDSELTPSQQRNIEDITDVRVVDRTQLILDIFAARARSGEGKLQVELAQLKYLLPRLGGKGTSMSRLGGGIGTRGPGETKLESDRRHIRRRIKNLEDGLEALSRRRKLARERREKDEVETVAIVGYTNAGKSTLMNALTQAGVLAEDKLFATLDPTSRALTLPDGRRVMLIDTVGFIRRLPHGLVEAFKSTLEEAVVSDFLLHVVDSSSPDAAEHIKTTASVLRELGADSKKIIVVMNKIDALSDDVSARALEIEFPDAVWVSAKTGEGLGGLLAKMEDAIAGASKLVKLLVPHSEYRAVAELYASGPVLSRRDTDDGAEISARIPLRKFPLFEKWISK